MKSLETTLDALSSLESFEKFSQNFFGWFFRIPAVPKKRDLEPQARKVRLSEEKTKCIIDCAAIHLSHLRLLYILQQGGMFLSETHQYVDLLTPAFFAIQNNLFSSLSFHQHTLDSAFLLPFRCIFFFYFFIFKPSQNYYRWMHIINSGFYWMNKVFANCSKQLHEEILRWVSVERHVGTDAVPLSPTIHWAYKK